jgi:hypothetical protein
MRGAKAIRHAMEPTRITLRAAHPSSLEDPALQELLRASLAETAEHQGIPAPDAAIFADRVEIVAPVPLPIAIALVSEFRRATGAWHRRKYGAPLWHGE